MSRRKQQHRKELPEQLKNYCDARSIDFHRYSEYHMRLMDGGFIVLDVWTTGKYFVLQTDYYKLTKTPIIERGGEKGMLPSYGDGFIKWLDDLFFAADKVAAS